jgi:hypothetical protein
MTQRRRDGMCPICTKVPRAAGRQYCAGCDNRLSHARQKTVERAQRRRSLAGWDRGPASERKAPVDWRTVLGESKP